MGRADIKKVCEQVLKVREGALLAVEYNPSQAVANKSYSLNRLGRLRRRWAWPKNTPKTLHFGAGQVRLFGSRADGH